MKTHQIAVAALTFMTSIACHADYVRTGPMKATVCSGFVIKACSPHEVKAIGEGGELYEPSTSFASVDKFRSSKCTIITSSSNVITAAIKYAKSPDFYKEEGGKLVKISPDYVTFNCFKR